MKGWERSSGGFSIRPLVFSAPQLFHRPMRMNLVQRLKSHWIDILGFIASFSIFLFLVIGCPASRVIGTYFSASNLDLTNDEFAGVEGLYLKEQNQSLFYATRQDFSQDRKYIGNNPVSKIN